MKRRRLKYLLTCIASCALAVGMTLGCFTGCAKSGGAGSCTVTLEDNKALIANKGMGWNFCYYSNELEGYGFETTGPNNYLDDFPCDIVYFRIGWNFIQPDKEFYNKILVPMLTDENGKLTINYSEDKCNQDNFCWDVIDRIADGWIENGKRVAFRITLNDGWNQCAPLWLKDLGAQGVEYDPITEGSSDKLTKDSTNPVGYTTESMEKCFKSFTKEGEMWYCTENNGEYGKGRKTWVPRYEDPVMLEYLEKFMVALRDRYDENIEFVEIGTFGTWGEGHTNRSLPTKDAGFINSTAAKAQLDLYHRVFGTDYTVIAWDYLGQQWSQLRDLAIEYGFGSTDDSLQVPGSNDGANVGELSSYYMAGNYVGLETHPGTIAEEVYYNGVNDAHASYARLLVDPEKQKTSDFYEPITLRLGYRINFTEASISNFAPGKTVQVDLKVKNVGAAPCYVGGHPTIIIKDQSMTEVARGVSEFDLKTLEVVNYVEDLETQETTDCGLTVELPKDMQEGVYYVFLCVTDENGEVFMNLPLDDGYNKQYRIATFNITA